MYEIIEIQLAHPLSYNQFNVAIMLNKDHRSYFVKAVLHAIYKYYLLGYHKIKIALTL